MHTLSSLLLVTPVTPLNSINPSVKASALVVPPSQLFLSIKVQSKPSGLSLITFAPILIIFFYLLPCGRMAMRSMGSTTSLSLLTRLCLSTYSVSSVQSRQKKHLVNLLLNTFLNQLYDRTDLPCFFLNHNVCGVQLRSLSSCSVCRWKVLRL